MNGIQYFFCGLARKVLVPYVNQDQVVVAAAGNQVEASLYQFVAQGMTVFHDLFRVHFEVRLQCFLQGNGLSGDNMHQGSALHAGEYSFVNGFSIFFPAEDQSAPGSPEGFVCGSSHYVSVRYRTGMEACGHQAGNMSHVYKQIGAHFMGNFRKPFEIDYAGISACSGNDHFRFMFQCQLSYFIVIDELGLTVYAVRNKMIQLAGGVHRASVGKMSSVGKIHAHYGIPGIQQGKINSHVGLGAGMGLHIGMFGPEQFLCSFNSQAFRYIHALAATVITVGRITFRILIGHDAAHCFHDCNAGVVLRGDHFQVALLAQFFHFNGVKDFLVNNFQFCFFQ